METKHTKGEWKVLSEKFTRKPKEIVTGVGLISDLGYGKYITVICDMITPGSDEEYIKEHEEIKANARLIAAAPDLLEALIQWRKAVNEKVLMKVSNEKDVQWFANLVKESSALIEKATE